MIKFKNKNGITLIALVITIIILLILAGISISSLTNNGLFGKTEEADRKTDIAQIKEDIQLDIYAKQLENLGTISNVELESILKEYGTVNYEDNGNIKGITTEKGYEIPMSDIYTGEISDIGGGTPSLTITDTEDTKPSQAMPEGATVIENDPSKGIVIADKNGNEWTWVEVPKTKVFTTATGADQYDNIKANLISYATNYRKNNYIDEWYDYCGTTYDGTNQYSQVKDMITSSYFTNAKNYYGTIYTDAGTTEATEYVEGTTYYADITQKLTDTSGCGLTYVEYKENYEKMLSSVYTNGGFWISRYEIGDNTSTNNNYTTRTSSSGTSGTAVSKADQIPYNYVTCSQAQTLANGMSTDENKTSSLLFGIQWDLTCKFIEEKTDLELADINSDSTSWGNYSNSSLTLNRGKYNTNPGNSTSVWTPFDTDTKKYVTNKQTSSNTSYGQLLTTGASEGTNKMNIYDFAGNEYEWTLEHETFYSIYPCAYRGGGYASNGSDVPASFRNGYNASFSRDSIAFRSALY